MPEAIEWSQDGFEDTGWNVFKEGSNLHIFTETVTVHTMFCQGVCFPHKRVMQYSNSTAWCSKTIKLRPKLERGALFNRFFGEPAHGPPHVAGGAFGPIGGCRDESRTDNPDLDLRHVFDRNNRKTDLI